MNFQYLITLMSVFHERRETNFDANQTHNFCIIQGTCDDENKQRFLINT